MFLVPAGKCRIFFIIFGKWFIFLFQMFRMWLMHREKNSSTCWWTCCQMLSISSYRPLSPPLCQVASQRMNSVDLSCCSLEELPAQLFYSQDLTHLNLKNNFMSPNKGIPALARWVCVTPAFLCVHQNQLADEKQDFPLLSFWKWNVPLWVFLLSWGATI